MLKSHFLLNGRRAVTTKAPLIVQFWLTLKGEEWAADFLLSKYQLWVESR